MDGDGGCYAALNIERRETILFEKMKGHKPSTLIPFNFHFFNLMFLFNF